MKVCDNCEKLKVKVKNFDEISKKKIYINCNASKLLVFLMYIKLMQNISPFY